jgi:N-acetylneuraminic acid mutarotase
VTHQFRPASFTAAVLEEASRLFCVMSTESALHQELPPMKRRWTVRSYLFSLRGLAFGAACLIIVPIVSALALFGPDPLANHSQRVLTFVDRVAYQRVIEEVYWRHRIWPKANAKPKRSLDSVISEAELENKVADYLRKSQALEEYWQRPITSEQLQAEMDRMAKDTKRPSVLREVFAALGNDPFVIAECLARPVLAERLTADRTVVAGVSPASAKLFTADTAASTENRLRETTPSAPSYRLPEIFVPNGCTDDTWTATNTKNAPAPRASHTAIWTGSEMIVWGGYDGSYLNTGGRYDPSTDSWAAISTMNAPAPRGGNTAVWTGSEMIVWGGDDGFSVNTGGRYNPATDTWTATNTTTAPLGRIFHTAVWDGSEMIVWGGWNEFELGTGGRYNPGSDTWAATSITNAPSARFDHAAVWTGSEMIVWAGWNGSNSFNTGGKYNPSTDSWAATSTTNAPTPRYDHTGVWTGNEMIVWGGKNAGNYFNTGGRYNPSADSWAATSTTNAPGARFNHTAVWSDSDMIVWGGTDMLKQFNTGGRYNPGTESWVATAGFNAPERRAYHAAVWSGSEMIVWGGLNDLGPFFLNTGGRYCAQPSATPTPTPGESCVVKEVSPCKNVVHTPPSDFVVQMSCPVELVQPSAFMVNNIGPNSFTVSKSTITFHYNTSPTVPGLNTVHMLFDAVICCKRSSSEFTCTFSYVADTPTPTPTASSTSTPGPRPTPAPRPRPTPNPRP